MINKLFKNLPESVRQTITAGFPLFLVIIFFIFVGKYGISKVTDIRSQIESAQSSEMVLTQKLSVLQTVSSMAESGARASSLAVPATNPSLIVVSQLRNLAAGNGVILSAIKSTTGASTASGLNQAIISFTVDGARPQVFSFLSGIDKIAPISLVDKIRITESGGGLRADIGVKSFWAEFPKTIPSVTTPISDLTPAEKETLTKILGLIQPSFTEVTAAQGEANPNPFGQ